MPRLCCAIVLVDGGRLTRIGTAYEYVSGHRTWAPAAVMNAFSRSWHRFSCSTSSA